MSVPTTRTGPCTHAGPLPPAVDVSPAPGSMAAGPRGVMICLACSRKAPVKPMPGDHIAADGAGHGRLGASHADCEQVIEVLKIAFVQGRLTKDEFGTRVGQAVTSQTDAELTEVTADLPAGLTGVRPPRQLARTRPRLSMNAAISAGAFAML